MENIDTLYNTAGSNVRYLNQKLKNGILMSLLLETINAIKARPSKKQAIKLLAELEKSLDYDDNKTLDSSRNFFMQTHDIKGMKVLDNFLNKICTHHEELNSFEEGPAWRTFALSVLLKHKTSLVLTHCIGYDSIKSVIKTHTKKTYPLEIFRLIFPTEHLKKYSIADTVSLAFDLKKTLTQEDSALKNSMLSAKNIDISSSLDEDLFEGIIFFNVFCSAEEAENFMEALETLPGSPLVSDQMIYATDQHMQVHGVKVLICDAGPVWSLAQDSIHTVDTIRAMTFIKKAVSKQKSVKNIRIAAAVYENELNSNSIKLSITDDDLFLGGLDIFNIEYPSIFIEKLDSVLDSLGISPCIRGANRRNANNLPLENEYYTPKGWCVISK